MAIGFGFLDFLRANEFPLDVKTKVARHASETKQLIREGWFEHYQAYQVRTDFHGAEYVVSFLALENSLALFHAVYKVRAHLNATAAPLPPECPYQEWGTPEHDYYDLEEVAAFSEFKHRLVIDWGKSERAWLQNLKNWPVVELRKERKGMTVFRDYLDFNISHAELTEIVGAPHIHEDWMVRLSAVSGIYLILDTITGQQYVGSAYGDEGIWGRWRSYAETGHGGNKMLRELVASGPGYPGAFQYSLLQVLPRSMDTDSVIQWESIFKEKLGSRATGLNLN